MLRVFRETNQTKCVRKMFSVTRIDHHFIAREDKLRLIAKILEFTSMSVGIVIHQMMSLCVFLLKEPLFKLCLQL